MGLVDRTINLLSHPGMIPVVLGKPPAMSISECAGTLLSVPSSEIQKLERELAGDESFQNHLNAALIPKVGRGYVSDGWAEFLYCVVRVTRPELVIETGVFQGSSSAFMLRAMDRNRFGRLISIDLPTRSDAARKDSTDRAGGDGLLPAGCEPGWIIPDNLRVRHELRLGNSLELLPQVFSEFQETDIFVHDSLHTEGHMTWEYGTAWPHIKSRGLLLSDDIFWNPAMHRFSGKVGVRYVQCLGKFGGIRKP